jgi:hypothetical protein
MATKRTPIHRDHRPTITPEMVELFARCFEIQRTGAHEIWGEDGGRQREFLDTDVLLQRLLKRPVGQHHLFDSDAGYDRDGDLDPDDPDWRDWAGARAVYRALKAALKQANREAKARRVANSKAEVTDPVSA